MNTSINLGKMGARFLSPEESSLANLGPLAPLIGEWHGLPPAGSNAISNGWNTISIPGPDGFVFEVIPYQEVLKFSPVVIQAGNRGPIVGGAQVEQLIYGLMYEQEITSVCDTQFCADRGFSAGTAIHAETGLFVFIGTPNGGYNIARLSIIPHGNSVLALGSALSSSRPGTAFFPAASSMPTRLDGSPVTQLGYGDVILNNNQFKGIFDSVNPNTFLQKTLQEAVGAGTLTDMTTLNFTTITPDADGGILNIPFISSNVDARSMTAVFWIEIIEGVLQPELLQYTQTVNLVFPPTGSAEPIVWPHVNVNTLVKVSQKASLLEDA